MDELFTRYMYYERAKNGIKSSTTEALRKFYEKDGYSLLKKDETFENLNVLATFWNDVSNQSIERFSDKVLRRLFVLNYAPNGMCTYSVEATTEGRWRHQLPCGFRLPESAHNRIATNLSHHYDRWVC